MNWSRETLLELTGGTEVYDWMPHCAGCYPTSVPVHKCANGVRGFGSSFVADCHCRTCQPGRAEARAARRGRERTTRVVEGMPFDVNQMDLLEELQRRIDELMNADSPSF